MADLTIHVYSHNFAVSLMGSRPAQEAVIAFARRNVQYALARVGNRWVNQPKCVYASRMRDGSVYRFHINQFEDFKRHLLQFSLHEHNCEVIVVPLQPHKHVELPIREGWVPREEQPQVIEYLTNDLGPRSRFVNLQTGKGKSFVTMTAASIMAVLGVYLFRPAYLHKWVADIKKTYDVQTEDIMVIQGSASLMELLELVRTEKFNAKVLLVSNKTYQNWLKLYVEYGEKITDMGYACTPPVFFEFLGAGLRVIDEAHLDFHLNFLTDLFTHIHRSISLSATLISDDQMIERMHDIAYPVKERYEGGAYDRYVSVWTGFFHLRDPDKARWMERNQRYSHITFEQSLMRNKDMIANYIELIRQTLEVKFMKTYQPGDKVLIFCASIEMCTLMTEKFKAKYRQLRVERYVGSLNDPYENLTDADIRFSTHGSAGTAQDIDQLTCVIMTIAMRSSPGSLQNIGRLRKLKDGRTPTYVFLLCDDIPQHRQYHEHRVKLLEHRAETFRSDRIGLLV